MNLNWVKVEIHWRLWGDKSDSLNLLFTEWGRKKNLREAACAAQRRNHSEASAMFDWCWKMVAGGCCHAVPMDFPLIITVRDRSRISDMSGRPLEKLFWHVDFDCNWKFTDLAGKKKRWGLFTVYNISLVNIHHYACLRMDILIHVYSIDYVITHSAGGRCVTAQSFKFNLNWIKWNLFSMAIVSTES